MVDTIGVHCSMALLGLGIEVKFYLHGLGVYTQINLPKPNSVV